MSAEENKRLMRAAYEALAKGDTRPFVDLMDDDYTVTVIGGVWDGVYKGKDAVRNELYGPVYAQFADRYTGQLVSIVAEGDVVVVEQRGCVTTKRGDLYANRYAMIFGLKNGRLKWGKEYCDTALGDRVLDPPQRVAAEAASA